jgi:hypothetical protein
VIHRVLAGLAAGALFVLCLASRSDAQMQVEIGATIGYYSPMGSFQAEQAHLTDLPSSPSSLSGTAIGGDLRLWLVPRVGLELAGSTTASSVGGGATPEGGRPAVPARVNVGTAELLFRSRAMAIGRECGSVPVRQRFDTAESRTRSSGSR